MQRGEIGTGAPGGLALPAAFPPPSSRAQQQQQQQQPRIGSGYYLTPYKPPFTHFKSFKWSDDDMMDIDADDAHAPLTPPRSLTASRGLKRDAEESADDLQQAQRLDEPQQPQTRRVAGMLTTIPHQLWALGNNVVSGFISLFRPSQAHTQTHHTSSAQSTRIEGVATDQSGRKRRAVDVTLTNTPHQPRVFERDSSPMIVTRAPHAFKAPQQPTSSFEITAEQVIARRARDRAQYFGEQNADRMAAKLRQQKQVHQPTTHGKPISIKDRQVEGIVYRSHRAVGVTFRQKAALKVAAAQEAARREAAEQEAAEKAKAEAEAAEQAKRKEAAEKEEARVRAEEEAAALAQGVIKELPETITTKLQNSLKNTAMERDTVIQLGSIPLQKVTFQRILASEAGTDNWLDDDAVNAWFNSIVEAKKRQRKYVKSDTNPPPFANLQTAWFSKAKKDGPASLKRWMKRAGVGGVNLLKCERLFLPINNGSHWTLLIINGTNTSIEYLDSMHGSGSRYFQMARDLLKSELGDRYNAQAWMNLTRDSNISGKQGNGSDCGVFTCLNGLAAAKDKSYRAVTAEKMPTARKMIVGVFVNGGFDGEFDL